MSKSHVAKAIAYAAIRQGLRVAYGEADELLDQLAVTTAAERRVAMKPFVEADLLVLDDLFLTRQLSLQSADMLQSLLHQRYKLRRSTLITSNRILDDWKSFLGDAVLTTAILDRLLHRSALVEFRGKSYRLKEAASRLAKASANE
jgi:DNA replication protein DnaC